MQLPKLAVQCSLRDIVPNNNSTWSKSDNTAIDNCFNADKYKCIFHDFSDNQYTVSLIHNGQNVGNMLVHKNLAAFATKTSVETVCGKDYFKIHLKNRAKYFFYNKNYIFRRYIKYKKYDIKYIENISLTLYLLYFSCRSI